jgi:hypothetical protein
MGLFKSKKFWMAIAGVVGEVALYFLGVPLETSMAILSPVIAFILGQGIADLGKGAK